jgi:hypothetical protein
MRVTDRHSARVRPPGSAHAKVRIVLVLEIVLLAILFVAWVVCLFLLVVDSIPFWQKVVWFLALTILAPIGIPAYLLARRGRAAQAPSGL